MLEAYEKEDEGWDQDDSDAEGNTAWERSPFFRLLNANTIKMALMLRTDYVRSSIGTMKILMRG